MNTDDFLFLSVVIRVHLWLFYPRLYFNGWCWLLLAVGNRLQQPEFLRLFLPEFQFLLRGQPSYLAGNRFGAFAFPVNTFWFMSHHNQEPPVEKKYEWKG